MSYRHSMFTIITIIGLTLILGGLLIIISNPIKVKIGKDFITIPQYYIEYKPPGNYTEHKTISLLKKLYEGINIQGAPYSISIFIPGYTSNTTYNGCKITGNKSLYIKVSGTTPNEKGMIFIAASYIVDKEEHVIDNKTITLRALSGKLYETASHLSGDGWGVEEYYNGNLLVEYEALFPLGNFSGNVTVTIGSNLSLSIGSLLLEVDSPCIYSYELKQPLVNIRKSSKPMWIPSYVVIDDSMFKFGTAILTVGVFLVLIDVLLAMGTTSSKRTYKRI